MKETTILAIVAIVAALGAATSLISIHQVSAQAKGPPTTPPNSHAGAACSQAGASHVPFCGG